MIRAVWLAATATASFLTQDDIFNANLNVKVPYYITFDQAETSVFTELEKLHEGRIKVGHLDCAEAEFVCDSLGVVGPTVLYFPPLQHANSLKGLFYRKENQKLMR
jgi:hypothetical protein